MQITDLKITTIDYSALDADVVALISQRFVPQRAEFKLKDASNAVGNAIRRVLIGEFPIKALSAHYDDASCDDPNVILPMILHRLRLIPIDQSVELNTVYSLDVTNKDVITRVVTTDAIVGRGSHPFNTAPLLHLQAGKTITIKNIRVVSELNSDFAGQTIAPCAVSLVDESAEGTLYNAYEDVDDFDKFVSRNNYRNWIIKFDTNGTMPVKDILNVAFSEISRRLQAVKEYKPILIGSEYRIEIPNETHTIGGLIMRYINDETSASCVYNCDTVRKTMQIRVPAASLGDIDINDVINDCIKFYDFVTHLR